MREAYTRQPAAPARCGDMAPRAPSQARRAASRGPGPGIARSGLQTPDQQPHRRSAPPARKHEAGQEGKRALITRARPCPQDHAGRHRGKRWAQKPHTPCHRARAGLAILTWREGDVPFADETTAHHQIGVLHPLRRTSFLTSSSAMSRPLHPHDQLTLIATTSDGPHQSALGRPLGISWPPGIITAPRSACRHRRCSRCLGVEADDQAPQQVAQLGGTLPPGNRPVRAAMARPRHGQARADLREAAAEALQFFEIDDGPLTGDARASAIFLR